MPVKKMASLLRSSSTNRIIVKKNSRNYLLAVKKKKRKIVVTTRKPYCNWTKNMWWHRLYPFRIFTFHLRRINPFLLIKVSFIQQLFPFKRGTILLRWGNTAKNCSFKTAYFVYNFRIIHTLTDLKTQVFVTYSWFNFSYEIFYFRAVPLLDNIPHQCTNQRSCPAARLHQNKPHRKCKDSTLQRKARRLFQ